jgi:hypothetical protein
MNRGSRSHMRQSIPRRLGRDFDEAVEGAIHLKDRKMAAATESAYTSSAATDVFRSFDSRSLSPDCTTQARIHPVQKLRDPPQPIG